MLLVQCSLRPSALNPQVAIEEGLRKLKEWTTESLNEETNVSRRPVARRAPGNGWMGREVPDGARKVAGAFGMDGRKVAVAVCFLDVRISER